MFRLVHSNKIQLAGSLARAKVVAPLMFREVGTQYWMSTITVLDPAGRLVGTFDRHGWHDPRPRPIKELGTVEEGL